MYAKIFRQIYESSIAEDPQVRFTFMDMLVLADSDGVVDMTPEAIARITNVPLAWVKNSIAVLEGPDPRSRTNEHGGARIARLDAHRDWGWVILNYDRFRDIATEEQRRHKTRERVRKHRAIRSQVVDTKQSESYVTQCNASVTPPYAYPSVVAVPERGGVGEGQPLTFNDAFTRTMNAGIPEDFCKYVYDDWSLRGGKDAASNEVPWLGYVVKRWTREQNGWKDGSHNGKHGLGHKIPPWQQKQALETEIAIHPANPSSLSCKGRATPEQRSDLAAKRQKLRDLNTLIANG